MYHLLVVDDYPINTKILTFHLTKEGYGVTAVNAPAEALAALRHNVYDLIFLDIMMPGLDGLELCRRIRTTSTTPIIFISALGESQDKVAGLKAGGDDYISKPFDPSEVLARTSATLRRSSQIVTTAARLKTADLILDPIDNQVTVVRSGKTVSLTPTEARLLRLLVSNPGRTLTRATLMANVWDGEDTGDSTQLDVVMHRLRRKIQADPGHPQLLLTRRGVGYTYQPSVVAGTFTNPQGELLSRNRAVAQLT